MDNTCGAHADVIDKLNTIIKLLAGDLDHPDHPGLAARVTVLETIFSGAGRWVKGVSASLAVLAITAICSIFVLMYLHIHNPPELAAARAAELVASQVRVEASSAAREVRTTADDAAKALATQQAARPVATK